MPQTFCTSTVNVYDCPAIKTRGAAVTLSFSGGAVARAVGIKAKHTASVTHGNFNLPDMFINKMVKKASQKGSFSRHF
jgi:hypothetical protein